MAENKKGQPTSATNPNTPVNPNPTGQPMEHKETSKPVPGTPKPDAENPDTNANMGEDKPNLTSRPSVETKNEGKWANIIGKSDEPSDPNSDNKNDNKDDNNDNKIEEQKNYNPHPVTAGSEEDLRNSAGETTNKFYPGQIIQVSPLNAADEDEVVGKITGINVAGLGYLLYVNETNEMRLVAFHADDAKLIYDPPSRQSGRKIFINDDQTYDARELRMERPKYEKQYVDKQEVLRDQTAKSQFNKQLTTR